MKSEKKGSNFSIVKVCTDCKLMKNSDSFTKDKSRGDGLQARCKDCEKHRYVQRRKKQGKSAYRERMTPKKTPHGFRKCRRCKTVHAAEHYVVDGALKTNCDTCRDYLRSDEFAAIKQRRQRKATDKYRAANPDKVKKTYSDWAKLNRSINHRRRMKTDPSYALNFRIRDILARTLRVGGLPAKVASAEKQLGYTVGQLRRHLEQQFEDGMTWFNRGDWHIDHIKPVVQFIKEGVTDPAVINALENLQPLWADQNRSKGAKYDPC